jgi:hypothetical protein
MLERGEEYYRLPARTPVEAYRTDDLADRATRDDPPSVP